MRTLKEKMKHLMELNKIFYRYDKYSLIDNGIEWFSDTPTVPGSTTYGNDCPRMFTWATLKHIKTRKIVLVLDAHLDVESENARNMGIKQINNFVRNFTAVYDMIVIAGDFNCTKAHVKIEEFGFMDSYRWKEEDPIASTLNDFFF